MPTHPSAEFLALQAAVAGRYSLDREMGRGGMGIVFLARDVALDRLVAIKLLPPVLANIPEARERFLREARTAGKLSHPNIVPIHAVEEHDENVFFVMAYINGESVGDRIRRRGALPPSQVGRIVQEVAWALGYAHTEGVVHRDIKPDNILLEKRSDRALVTDFGIARVAEAGTMTAKGELIGTLHYMSPEQAAGETVDGRSDLYSLGVTAFHALTGRLPFDGPDLPAIIRQHVTEPAPRVATLARRVPPRLGEAVDRCLEKEPAQRFATAADLATVVNPLAAARSEAPAEVRSLLRLLRDFGIFFSGTLGLLLVFPAVLEGLKELEIAGPVLVELFFPVVVVMGVWLMSYPVRLVGMSRRAIQKGLGLADFRAALVDEARALDEELTLRLEQRKEGGLLRVFRYEPLDQRNREDLIRKGGPFFLILGLVFALGLIPIAVSGFESLDAVRVLIMIFITLGPGLFLYGAGPPVDEDSPLRALPIAQRLLIGRFGRLLFRVAGIGLKRKPDAPATDQLTEAFLASAADQIFDRLPSEIRRRFENVPAVIERLEAAAKTLRKREASLSRAVAEAAPNAAPRSGLEAGRREAVSDLESARERVRERLEDAVTALEKIRLDLLRLHADIGSPDDLTAALEKAREVGDAIDAEMEVRGVLVDS